ncbi:hypothetical protein MLD38_037203 [Melastoma candidum]|uniref:Uncharacterized protein n=1 Tax=Melastoma candidum TaxID=119954 RepID=A0ACB9LNY5_9MYRT|nr:hypothetical protein MLD38_037203 [Melastoma candidum]
MLLEFNVMIKAYGIANNHEKACQLFDSMETQGVDPDKCSYNFLIQILSTADLPRRAMPYLKKMQEAGLIGMLCMQELTTDRSTMSTVVFMLGNNTVLASPQQPTYIIKKKNNMGTTNNSSSDNAASVNQVTISIIEGR